MSEAASQWHEHGEGNTAKDGQQPGRPDSQGNRIPVGHRGRAGHDGVERCNRATQAAQGGSRRLGRGQQTDCRGWRRQTGVARVCQ